MNRDKWETLFFSKISHRSWNDEHFIYNPITGNTHVLNDLSWICLEQLHLTASDSQSLLERLHKQFPDSKNELTLELLQQHLSQMLHMGLIKQSSENVQWLASAI